MDRDFIARNQVVERYLSGRLPIKGATDFESFCREHPELLDELGLPERVNAALRLLEASGKPEPWAEPPKPFWQRIEIPLGLLAVSLVLAIALVGRRQRQRAEDAPHCCPRCGKRANGPSIRQPVRATSICCRAATAPPTHLPSSSAAAATRELADFRIDESRSPFRLFRITIDRINQGRVGVIDHIAKDSDGNLRIALNSSALGPGNYQLTIEALNWQGQPLPDSWITIGVQATK